MKTQFEAYVVTVFTFALFSKMVFFPPGSWGREISENINDRARRKHCQLLPLSGISQVLTSQPFLNPQRSFTFSHKPLTHLRDGFSQR